MRVARANRDKLAEIAKTDLGGVTLDDALAVLLFEYEYRRALERLAADEEALAD